MTKQRQPKLFLHQLIGALSYWGTTTRVLLVGFVLGLLAMVHMLDAGSLNYIQPLIYVVGCFFLLDAGYVTISRGVPFHSTMADKLFLWLVLMALFIVAVLPYIAVLNTGIFHQFNTWLLLIVLFILSVRLVLGLVQKSDKQ